MDDNTTQTDRARGLHSLTEAEWEQKMLQDGPMMAQAKVDPHEQYERTRNNIAGLRSTPEGPPSSIRFLNAAPRLSRWQRFKRWLFGRS